MEIDLAGFVPDAAFRAAQAPGTNDVDWKQDGLDEEPFQYFAGVRLSVLSGHRSSLGFQWQGMVLAAYPDSVGRNVVSGPSTIPAGSDLDAVVQVHSLSAWWRRDWVVSQWGGLGAGAWYSMLGLSHDMVSMVLDSDAFPVSPGRHKMAQLLPMPLVGMGVEVMGRDNLFRLEARASLLPSMSTMQKVRGADVDQSSLNYELSAVYEFGLADWLGFGITGRWLAVSHELEGTTIDQSVDISGPAIGVRLSFKF